MFIMHQDDVKKYCICMLYIDVVVVCTHDVKEVQCSGRVQVPV